MLKAVGAEDKSVKYLYINKKTARIVGEVTVRFCEPKRITIENVEILDKEIYNKDDICNKLKSTFKNYEIVNESLFDKLDF